MSRQTAGLILLFGLAIALTQVMGALLEASRTTHPTNADATKALETGARSADLSCASCGRP